MGFCETTTHQGHKWSLPWGWVYHEPVILSVIRLGRSSTVSIFYPYFPDLSHELLHVIFSLENKRTHVIERDVSLHILGKTMVLHIDLWTKVENYIQDCYATKTFLYSLFIVGILWPSRCPSLYNCNRELRIKIIKEMLLTLLMENLDYSLIAWLWIVWEHGETKTYDKHHRLVHISYKEISVLSEPLYSCESVSVTIA